MISDIARCILTLFILMQGFSPNDDDFEVKDYGPHIIYSLSAESLDEQEVDFNADVLFNALSNDLALYHRTSNAIRFQPYRCEGYPGVSRTSLYVSIYL